MRGYDADEMGARERKRWTASWDRSSAAGTKFSLPERAMEMSSLVVVVLGVEVREEVEVFGEDIVGWVVDRLN